MAEEEVSEEGGLRSQMWKHSAMVDFINKRDDVDLDTMTAAEIIAYAFARRVEWRQSETYQEIVEAHKATAQEEKAAKAEARAAAAAAKAAEKEAEKATKAEKAEKAPAKATKATKTPAKATKATKATKASKKTADGDSPFE